MNWKWWIGFAFTVIFWHSVIILISQVQNHFLMLQFKFLHKVCFFMCRKPSITWFTELNALKLSVVPTDLLKINFSVNSIKHYLGLIEFSRMNMKKYLVCIEKWNQTHNMLRYICHFAIAGFQCSNFSWSIQNWIQWKRKSTERDL